MSLQNNQLIFVSRRVWLFLNVPNIHSFKVRVYSLVCNANQVTQRLIWLSTEKQWLSASPQWTTSITVLSTQILHCPVCANVRNVKLVSYWPIFTLNQLAEDKNVFRKTLSSCLIAICSLNSEEVSSARKIIVLTQQSKWKSEQMPNKSPAQPSVYSLGQGNV